MRNIHRAARCGNSHTPEQIATQQAAKALLGADKTGLDKADREFLKVVGRHGLVTAEGAARLVQLAWLLNGGRQ